MLAPQSTSGRQPMLPCDRGQPLAYVALGDSTVYGQGASSPAANYVSRLAAQLRTIYPQTALTNLGVNGATASDVVEGQLRRAVALQPQLVTLSVGPNDLVGGRSATAFEQDIDAILRTLASQTKAVVVVNLLPDLLPDLAVAPALVPSQRAAVGAQVVRFNDALRHVVPRYSGVLVDLYGPSQQQVSNHPELLAADYYHPSDAGYARWAEIMWRGVAERLPADAFSSP